MPYPFLYYPFLLYDRSIAHLPVFSGLEGAPFIADLSPTSELLKGLAARDQRTFQTRLEEQMGTKYRWGLAAYLERRDTLLGDCPQMAAEKRFVHLGLDVIVPLRTPLHAPLDSTVLESGYESGEGNYGCYVLLRHDSGDFQPFFSFYGHLAKASLPAAGKRLKAGDTFAEIGDFAENGNWFHHTHIQVITERGLAEGYGLKGYCCRENLAQMNELCPSPLPLFKTT